MNTIIEIRNATKRFKDKTVFENISLNFEKERAMDLLDIMVVENQYF